MSESDAMGGRKEGRDSGTGSGKDLQVLVDSKDGWKLSPGVSDSIMMPCCAEMEGLEALFFGG